MANRVGVAALLLTSLGWGLAPFAEAAPEGSRASLAELSQSLAVELVENGPAELWTLHVTNDGTSPVGIVADPSLLWFEVAVPGKAPVVCRLPAPLWPKVMRRRAITQLHPGERFSRRFDPRFFCFDDMRQSVLVVGARVTPHFGWPQETKEVRTKGVRSSVTLPPRAPFVAWALPSPPAPPPDAPAAGTPPPADAESKSPAASEPDAPSERPAQGAVLLDDEEGEAIRDQPEEGLKFVTGAAVVLTPAYEVWSRPPQAASGEGLHLLMRAGSDAEDERGAVITVALANGSAHPEQIFLRRELVTYHVLGPDGPFDCSPNEVGPPDFASFTTVSPRASDSMMVRLIEMCPRRALSRPGLYEVTASYESHSSGQALGLDAFVGRLEATSPALIRIRSGDQPSFLRAVPLSAVSGSMPLGGAPPGAPPQAPADGNVDAQPMEEAPPPEHEPQMEAPAPEAPADGTTVE